MAYDPHMIHRHSDPYHSSQQCQQEQQVFRNIQASKQMVYKVFCNVIGALEEVECRELGANNMTCIQKSGVQYADQSMRTNEDVQRQLDTQLLLFQAQIRSCAPEIKSAVKEELEKETLMWVSKRQERQLPKSFVDDYTLKLYQILVEGKTQHPDVFNQIPEITENDLKQNFQNVMVGEHERAKLDQEFRDNPDKEAMMEHIRGNSASLGAERMEENFPETKQYTEKHHVENLR